MGQAGQRSSLCVGDKARGAWVDPEFSKRYFENPLRFGNSKKCMNIYRNCISHDTDTQDTSDITHTHTTHTLMRVLHGCLV